MYVDIYKYVNKPKTKIPIYCQSMWEKYDQFIGA